MAKGKKKRNYRIVTDGNLITEITVTTDKPTAFDGSSETGVWDKDTQVIAVGKLTQESEIVVSGLTNTDRVRDRFARMAAETVYDSVLESSAVAPRPKSKTELRNETVAAMTADGATPEEIIAYLVAN